MSILSAKFSDFAASPLHTLIRITKIKSDAVIVISAFLSIISANSSLSFKRAADFIEAI